MAVMMFLSRVFKSLLAVGLCAFALIGQASANAQGQGTPDELPPVDSVFQLSAQAAGDELIEVSWKIAPGYYLYRHRTKVEASSGFVAGQMQIPSGTPHHDEFFGDVETYRDRLLVRLPGRATASQAVLQVKYQGCADAGLCYPPQTRTLHVRLPTAPVADSSFAALGARLGGGGQGASGAGGLLGTGKAAPLPPTQAFRVEVIADGGEQLLLRMVPARGYYIYRDKVSLQLGDAAGIRLGTARFPAGQNYHDEHFGTVKVYFDEVEVPVPLVRAGNARAARDITLHVGWQGCQDEGICYEPMRKTFRIDLPAAADDARVPASSASETSVGQVTRQAAAVDEPGDAAELGDEPETMMAAAALPDSGELEASPTGQANAAGIGLGMALLLALLGGLILNLMPCVLPVLSLKALALAQSGESRQQARRHALWYTLGVLAAFAVLGGFVLALRSQILADGMGWGFQLQIPWLVAGLALLVFAFGLSLSGLWYVQLGVPAAGEALTRKSGRSGDFFTGVLAVVLATPCTAPFMGAALAYAFVAPAAAAMAVFLMLGAGLALPFLMMGLIPALASRLPKPGAWMETLKQLLAFPMYLTAVWLVWVLVKQRGADAFALWALAATSLTFALWVWSHATHKTRRWPWRVLAGIGLAGSLASLHALAGLQRPVQSDTPLAQSEGQMAYDPAALEQLRARGQAVFVNITADWCVTCKANERAVLSRSDFKKALAENGVVYMVGDHTHVDPRISAFLQSHGAVGLPLYVVYPAGGGAPEILPTLLTPAIAREALQRAAR